MQSLAISCIDAGGNYMILRVRGGWDEKALMKG